jgi:hypothetical protein
MILSTTFKWPVVLLAASLALAGAAPYARADKSKFDMNARLYTKYLYTNDDTQGVLWLGNPFWPDDIAGSNGTATELYLRLNGNVSDSVRAWASVQSRFGGTWQDWWESGEWKYNGEHNTSGDSLGMNRAQYVKFRGFGIDVKLDVPPVRHVMVGASDLGMFNPFTIGKIRYIDRENGRGVFVLGGFAPEAGADDVVKFTAAAIALPKLWVGPSWSTGVGDDALDNPYISQDWAYGLRVDLAPPDADWLKVTWIGTYTRDVEFDRWDPDAQGSVNANCKDSQGGAISGCEMDHAVGTYPRFRNAVTTLEADVQPGNVFAGNFLVAAEWSDIGEEFAENGVKDNDGMFPMVYEDTTDIAGRARLSFIDPFESGLTFKLEGFYFGPKWTSVFAARREEDVLWTDGFLEGGQLPTLNLANEFIDFDEPWYESCVGWAGGTALLVQQTGGLEASLELTGLTYATNMQNRDIDGMYPTFLYSEGYTDTDTYDYANTTDRGRDPRSVYKRDQDRLTGIAVAKAAYTFDSGFKVEARLKHIYDDDRRKLRYQGHVYPDDDYVGNITTARLRVEQPLWSRMTVGLGGQFDYWDEQNREGDPDGGYADYLTMKQKGFLSLGYDFGGVKFTYYLEYLHKVQDRPPGFRDPEDQLWDVWRAKASLEVGW